MVMTMPRMRLRVEVLPASITPKLMRAVSMEATMVLTCVALPVPNTAKTPKMAKSTPSHFHFLPRPFWI